jgi:uncharacterized cupin superfamily protein
MIETLLLEPTGLADTGMGEWQLMTGAQLLTPAPRERNAMIFQSAEDDPRIVKIGVWECEAYAEQMTDYPYDEYMRVIEGSVIITAQGGEAKTYTVGDSFFMPKGFTGVWKQTETMKKYFAIYG